METIIQPLQDVSSSSKFLEKPIPKMLRTQNTQGHPCLHQNSYHSNPWWLMVYRKFQLPNLLGRFQKPVPERRDTYTHTPTLAQGRLEERHDKAGRTPEDAEPSLLLYDPLSASRIPVPLPAELFGTFRTCQWNWLHSQPAQRDGSRPTLDSDDYSQKERY